MTGVHSIPEAAPVATRASRQGAVLTKGASPHGRAVSTTRRDNDEALWSKLEDKLSERAVAKGQDGDDTGAATKSWFQNLIHGRWLRR